MNEPLRRALLGARLSEEDVAVRLEVDPKTVRRWLEGRIPYPRHRWMLAITLGLDEIDVWPHLSNARSHPHEVFAIYPHRDDVPGDLWPELYDSADAEISILEIGGLFFADDHRALAAIERRAASGVRVRICLRDLDPRELAAHRLGAIRKIEIRLHQDTLINSVYRSDDDLLVVQHAYGIPPGRAPVLHLHRARSADMAMSHLESFDRLWNRARPLPA